MKEKPLKITYIFCNIIYFNRLYISNNLHLETKK